MTSRKKSFVRLFRESCVVLPAGQVVYKRLKVSGSACVEAEVFKESWRECLPNCRFYNDSMGVLAKLMGGFAAHYALLAGRRTVLVDDVVFANARIKQEDFV